MTSASQAVPRVNSALLKQNVGGTVRLAGKVAGELKQDSTQMTLETSDKENVVVSLTNDAAIYLTSPFVEVVGKVEPNGTVLEYSGVALSSDFDLELYNKMVLLMNGKYRNLFF